MPRATLIRDRLRSRRSDAPVPRESRGSGFRRVAIRRVAIRRAIAGWASMLAVLAIALGGALAIAAPARAATDLARQPATTVEVRLGDETDALRFFPSDLTFEAGKRYKLHLVNPSPEKHYFTAKDFADNVWTQKVDAGGVEVKGAVHELELRSQTEADWTFVPVKAGTYDLRCTIAGHAEAGMRGTLTVR